MGWWPFPVLFVLQCEKLKLDVQTCSDQKGCGALVKSTNSGTRMAWYKSWFYFLWALCPWKSTSSLWASFPDLYNGNNSSIYLLGLVVEKWDYACKTLRIATNTYKALNAYLKITILKIISFFKMLFWYAWTPPLL